ncbi:MAG: septum site-determining protein MinC [Azonexus sp.]
MSQAAPIQFKGTTLKIIHALLGSADPAVLHGALAELTGNTADFFDGDLAVLDFSPAGPLADPIDWAAIRELLRGSGLSAVASRGLPPDLAAACGLPSVGDGALGRPNRGAPPAPEPPAAPAPAPAPASPPEAAAATPAAQSPVATTVLDKPLRSGQRFYARGGDLVVLAMVSAGAEVIADGHIHVYAPLRGRALAGAAGNAGARIFTTSLEAELVSIAGTYRTFEEGLPTDLTGRPAQISLEGGSLRIAPLALR